jgi:hypothetical protein
VVQGRKKVHMARKQAAAVPISEPVPPVVREPEAPVAATQVAPRANGSTAPAKEKPVHEVRIGRIKAVVWSNQTESGTRHNVTLRRIFKRDSNSQWEQSDSFGRDDLPLVMEVSRQAWLWIYDNSQR